MAVTTGKAEARRVALERRRSLGESERGAAAASIIEKLRFLETALSWRFTSCYLGYGPEVPTEDHLRDLLERGARVAVPYVVPDTKRLYLSEVTNLDTELTINRYGIKEPRREFLRPVPAGAPDAHIVPGVAFDQRGNRLGYGLGYYDRLLGDVRGRVPLVGLAFDCQILPPLPTLRHDVPMDLVITERRVLAPGAAHFPSLEAVLQEEV